MTMILGGTNPAVTFPDSTVQNTAFTGTAYPTGPAFSAYMSATQSIAQNVWTKLQMNTEDFDTNSNYDTTNYRFTPTVAGYYLVTGSCYFSYTFYNLLAVFKNGSTYKYGVIGGNTTGAVQGTVVSVLVYLNGSTDYVELYTQQGGATTSTQSGSALQYFQASMVRSA